eukprot:scaffold78084_cov63-Phaeocystis_antarctica.AAC.1
MHHGKRRRRSVQSRVGRRDGPHARRSAKSVAVACEADLLDNQNQCLLMQFLFTLVETHHTPL